MGGKRSRSGRLPDNDSTDEESFSTKKSRSRPKLSYNEDQYYDDLDEILDENKENNGNSETTGRKQYLFEKRENEDQQAGEEEDEYHDPENSAGIYGNDEDDYVGDDVVSRRRKRTSRSRKIASEDEDFEDEEVTDDDFLEKLAEKNFIATDDDEPDGYNKPPRRRRIRLSRSRSTENRKTRRTRSQAEDSKSNSGNESFEDEEENIKKEIEELYDSSPDNSPIKHKLRDRDQKVDYTIPPPLNVDNQTGIPPISSTVASFSRGRGRKNVNKSEYRKILFPTAGPFGGSDVISLFGTNIPPGGIPIPGYTNPNNMGAIGQSDSDSSEDEIAPINGEATVSKKRKTDKPCNITKLITGGSDDSKQKKKNNLSDTDPLGVDMNIDFSAIGGLSNYINQLKEMVALPLLYPELYQNFSITPPRGVLFHGPPGTGKTLMARALAASCSTSERKITFFMRKGADCLSKWVGEAERQLRLLFEEARNQQPAIIFFDEIDGLAPVRSSKQEQIHASIVSTLLALMDGMDNRGQVIVIGATNRPDSVDPALRRPGRFDREFYFPLPDISARKEILQINTRKWNPQLAPEFITKVAGLTKGYGGADLRALCTEAALNSIQRKYPQIYKTSHKLKVNPSKVKVMARDFMKALEKIVPSSGRSATSGSSPLPEHLKPLLEPSLGTIIEKIDSLLPSVATNRKKVSIFDEALYVDPTANDPDGGFSKHEFLKNIENARICKPHFLLCGENGNGQQYLSAAVLNYLEGFQVQSLDMGSIFGDPSRTPESSIVQAFIEAKRNTPSVIFIPNIDIWFSIVPHSAKATFTSLLRNLKSEEKILLFGIAETSYESLDPEIKLIFGLANASNKVNLSNPSSGQKVGYFKSLKQALLTKPFEFINDFENRPKRKLKELPIVKTEINSNSEISIKKKQRQQEYEDTKLKNVLKIKLAGLIDLFKNRYKRFRKPFIDENLLYHLFDPTILEIPERNYEILYQKSKDPNHENMIKEISTGRYYHNMDLDIIEERLWNGFYSEPKQFLKDIKMIVRDSITSGDRDRILKANEMLTNAQFGIDDFSTPEFIKSCKEMRSREIERNSKILEEHMKLTEEFKKKQLENIQDLNENGNGELNPIQVDDAQEEPKLNGTFELHSSNPKTINTSILIDESIEVHVASEEKDMNGKADQPDSYNEDPTAKQTTVTENHEVQEPEPESESEIEEELQIDVNKELLLGDKFDLFFDDVILKVTHNCNVEKLENIMAIFMEIVWNDRNSWDKTKTVEKLIESSTVIESL